MDRPEDKYLLRFPPYRSQSWIEENRNLAAVEPCLKGVKLEPKGLLGYSHVKAYEIKAESVRREMRNALFRQALFKIQNIEVLSYKQCKNYRLLLSVERNSNPLKLPNFITNKTGRPLLADETWTVDRCGDRQQYKVRYFKEGVDGFNCKVYVTSFSNLVNYIKFHLSL